MSDAEKSSLRPSDLAWTALLGKWIEVAQASLALPRDASGDRWRASVPAIINLQAVTFALAELGDVPAAERPLARDKAEMIIERAARELRQTWGALPMPMMLLEIGRDARIALERSDRIGLVELMWPGPSTMVMPDRAAAVRAMHRGEPPDSDASIAVMLAGTIVAPGEPVAWWCNHPGIDVEGCELRDVDAPRQVYRQLDEASGRFVRDLIAPLDDALEPGLPLLAPVIAQGELLGELDHDADAWLAMQRDAMPEDGTIIVETARATHSNTPASP